MYFLFFLVLQIKRAKSALGPGLGPGPDGRGPEHVQGTGDD